LSLHRQMQFPDMRAEELSSNQSVAEERGRDGSDLYGLCDHDLEEVDKIKIQHRITSENYYLRR
jgi:hypothetical protein